MPTVVSANSSTTHTYLSTESVPISHEHMCISFFFSLLFMKPTSLFDVLPVPVAASHSPRHPGGALRALGGEAAYRRRQKRFLPCIAHRTRSTRSVTCESSASCLLLFVVEYVFKYILQVFMFHLQLPSASPTSVFILSRSFYACIQPPGIAEDARQ